MTRSYLLFCTLLALLLGAAGLATTTTAAPLLENIEFDASGTNVDRITFQMNSTELPKSFTLKGPPRLIFDFPQTALKKGLKTNIPADGRFIKGIRSAEHRGEGAKTRVVLDLLSEQPVEHRQDFDAKTKTLVISIYPAGSEPEPAVPAAAPAAAPPAAPVEPAAIPTPEPPVKQDDEKTVAVEPPPAMEETPPVPPPAEPPVATVPEKKTPVEEKKAPAPAVASLPQPVPAEEKPGEEATVIQPLSEVGTQAAAAPGDSLPVLHSIEFDKNGNRGETISFKLNSFNPPVVFGIEEDSPRIVCFFKDTAADSGLPDTLEAKGRYVKSIQIGKYNNPANIRVVMDLVPNQNYDLQQIFFKEENLFMIIINTTGEKS